MPVNDWTLAARPDLQSTFREACLRHACDEAVVFVHDGITQRFSYGDLLRDASRFGWHLQQQGLEKGDHVAVWMPNGYEWIVTRFGVALAGLVLVPLNTRLRRDDLAQILSLSDAKALVAAERFADVDYLRILRSIGVLDAAGPVPGAEAAPMLRHVISTAARPVPGLLAFADFMRPVPDGADSLQAGTPQDVLNIIFTSGTTSLPKGVVVLNGAATHNLLRINERWGQRAQDRFLLGQPLFTSAGLGRSTSTLLGGATLVLGEGLDASEFIAVAQTERVTAAALTDTNVLDLMDLLRDRPAPQGLAIRVVLGLFSGGAESKHDFLRRRLGVKHVLSHYGLSETSHMTSLASPDDDPLLADESVGRPLPEVEVAIVDPATGRPCAAGQVGEIRIGGYITTPGYYGRSDATRDAFDDQERLRTGDLGWLDEAGFVHFQSRLKDMIRVGGFNVAAGEIESLLRSQAEIREAAVIAVPDSRLGEVPCAFVEFSDGRSLSVDQLRERLKGGVATYKLPRHMFEIDEWPRTGSEKIQKAVLVERARERLERAGAAA